MGEREEIAEAVVVVTVLGAGAPMDVLLNGKALGEELAVPGDGGHGDPRVTVLSVPGELLTVGDNLLEIHNPEGAEGLLRLRTVTVDPAHDRERSERARAARTAGRSSPSPPRSAPPAPLCPRFEAGAPKAVCSWTAPAASAAT
ncbi:hypothetical protein L1856_31550 [Streptomyces sp. Tue 6430]|nr:hypothetical protein [Streptomyces sp. Tue 6430]